MESTNQWERYFDTNSNAYYWYNHKTGESTWDELDTANMFRDETSSHEEIGLLEEAKATMKSGKRKSNETDSYKEKDSRSYQRFLLVSAVLFEAPLAIAEGILRCIVLALLVIGILLMKYVCRNPLEVDLIVLGKDVLLTVCACLTLLCPGTILYIYRSMDVNENWYISALPTVVGAVDCRRFASITIFGAGSLATNSLVSAKHAHLDIWPDSAFYYPKNTLIDWKQYIQTNIYYYRRRDTNDVDKA
jgi:hypothetical protein